MRISNQLNWIPEIIRRIIYRINRILKLRPTSAPYISGDTFRGLADYTIDSNIDLIKLDRCQAGSIIFCNTAILDKFIEHSFQKIKFKFILITHNSDHMVDCRHSVLLDHENLIHWFAQNNTLSHSKISTVPIGLENRSYHNHGRLTELRRAKEMQQNKICRILCAFSIHTNPEARFSALSTLKKSHLVDTLTPSSLEYKQVLSSYMFVASPAGNGIDCHRTWEALYLGTIPIVVGKEFYRSFPDFPGLVLDQWEDLLALDAMQLNDIFIAKSAQLKNTKYIWIQYWICQLKSLKLRHV